MTSGRAKYCASSTCKRQIRCSRPHGGALISPFALISSSPIYGDLNCLTSRVLGCNMKQVFFRSLVVFLGLSVGLTAAMGQNTNGSGNIDHSVPSYDMKAQSLVDLQALQKKFVDLATAVPGERF